ncbi:hypothetical protein AnigIFM49718_010766 [Aspergillus niger]|nr:hypothetical protein AnigIFM49718_010766 [Aspergillus niger]
MARPELLSDALLDKLKTEGEELIKSFYELWYMLLSVSAQTTAGEVICVLDALDECQDWGQLIEAVNKFYQESYTNRKLKFLMTSRPYPHIERLFRKLEANLPTIHLSGDGEEEVQQISREIGRVIRKRVSDLGEQRSLEEDECNFLEQQLTAVGNRTYLWISLTLDVLENMPGFTKGNIRRAIQHLPTTLDSAYERILDRSMNKKKARILLHLITAAVRPFSLEELSLAWAIYINRDDMALTTIIDDVESKERFRETLRDLCGLFVVIIYENVYLLHQTAKEFLVRSNKSTMNQNISQATGWKYALIPEDSNRILAHICISWVSLITTAQRDIERGDFDKYSSCHWITHYHQAGVQDGDPLIMHAKSISNPSSDVYSVWSKLYAAEGNFVPGGASELLIASWLGLTGLVKLLLARGKVDIESKDAIYGQTSLFCAAKNGCKAVGKLLFGTGKVDINSKDTKHRQTPLSWAAKEGHEAVVKLLLATGKADVDSRRNSLSLAAKNGHEAVVKLLLCTGKVNADSTGTESGRTPLSWAAENGHEAVVKLLLATGKVDVNFTIFGLESTAFSFNGTVLKLLIATQKGKEDDKSIRAVNGLTPLALAAFNGHEAVVKLLLATGKVDVNSKDIEYGVTPLALAALDGREAVVKLLLATGKVDINSKNTESGRTPLSWAAENGHEVVVKLLLATGKVDVNSKDTEYGMTPLALAALNGHEAVVKLLLATGKVDVNSKDTEYGMTPLALAALNGHEAVVKLLLATGKVEVDSKDPKYGVTPLALAALDGHEAVVKLLLATEKVDINSKDIESGRTPLSWAAENGHEAVVKLLLATGKVDVNSKDIEYGMTPLALAALNGHEAVVKLLLATGKVDVNS